MALPPLTPEQRAAALAKATEARRIRAAARQELKDAGPRVVEVLDGIVARAEHDEAIGKMRVASLLDALPGIGKVRAAALMERLEISPTRRVRGLGGKQRAALTAAFAQESADHGG
ncbi:MAG TPA: integration host factor, actinobacterial type [Mycobacteriales bacterium]